MSLINEALKRAKHSHQQEPSPSGGPPLKPADPAPEKGGGGARLLLFVLVITVVVGNLLLWIAFSREESQTAAAETYAPALTQAETNVASSPTLPPVSTVSPEPAVTGPAPVATPTIPAESALENPAQTGIATNKPASESAATGVVEPPQPTPLKLQSIIFNPSQPSAMISGKFLFIGDRIQGFRVTAIDKESVTLTGNGQTNVLELP